MCLGFLSFYQYEEYPVIILNNRDEEVSRPTIPLHEWDLNSDNETTNTNIVKIYGGRDKLGGGTWLATNNKGKFCMILNCYYRNKECFLPHTTPQKKSSRGKIVYDYLINENITAYEYIQNIEIQRNKYQPFILILGDISNSNNPVAYYYTSHLIPPYSVVTQPNYTDESIMEYSSKLEVIEKGTLFGISNYPVYWNTPRVVKGSQLINNKLKSIFGVSENGANSTHSNIHISQENENELLDIMLIEAIESEPPAPMEHINTSSIYVPPYTCTYTNKLRSTVSTSLILFENSNSNNNDSTTLKFIQIDNVQKKKYRIQHIIKNKL